MFMVVVVVVDVSDVGGMSAKVACTVELSLVVLSLMYTVAFWAAFDSVKTEFFKNRVNCACIMDAQRPAFLWS